MSHVLYRRSYPGPVYIHYGADRFDPELFKPIKNRPNWVKPEAHTGLWASPRNSERSWKTWVEAEHYGSDLTKSFEFRMSDPRKVFYIFDAPSYTFFIEQYGIINPFGSGDYTPFVPNFEKMAADGFDALEIGISSWPRLYDLFYGWDCDSILVFNKEAIEELSKEEQKDEENRLSIFEEFDARRNFMGDNVFAEWDAELHHNVFP
jgi:hypothetical protein